jgi:hypothetical protein
MTKQEHWHLKKVEAMERDTLLQFIGQACE